jgi:hypothetical protein
LAGRVGRIPSAHSPAHATAPPQARRRPANGWPPYHAAWQPGQAEMPPQAARTEGPPRTRPRRMDQSREAHPLGLAAPLPRGGPNPSRLGGTTLLSDTVWAAARRSGRQDDRGGFRRGRQDKCEAIPERRRQHLTYGPLSAAQNRSSRRSRGSVRGEISWTDNRVIAPYIGWVTSGRSGMAELTRLGSRSPNSPLGAAGRSGQPLVHGSELDSLSCADQPHPVATAPRGPSRGGCDACRTDRSAP